MKLCTVDEVKATEVPKVFGDTSLIGSYGSTEAGTKAMTDYSDLMEGSPVTKLAEKIGEIVTKLADADPQRVAKKPTWVERFTGRSVETHGKGSGRKVATALGVLGGAAVGAAAAGTEKMVPYSIVSFRDNETGQMFEAAIDGPWRPGMAIRYSLTEDGKLVLR